MEQDPKENKTSEFWEKNRNYIITAVIIVALVIVYFATKKPATAPGGQQNQQAAQQTGNQNQASQSMSPQNQNQSSSSPAAMAGNVSAVGKLAASDNPDKGNLMLDSNRGKIYIATQRDFSALVGKQATLMADGSLQSFTFLGFMEVGTTMTAAPTPQPANGMVQVSGTLENSDNASEGNYIVDSSAGKIYLKTAHDFSAWVGSQVSLSANGSVQSFTNGVLVKK